MPMLDWMANFGATSPLMTDAAGPQWLPYQQQPEPFGWAGPVSMQLGMTTTDAPGSSTSHLHQDSYENPHAHQQDVQPSRADSGGAAEASYLRNSMAVQTVQTLQDDWHADVAATRLCRYRCSTAPCSCVTYMITTLCTMCTGSRHILQMMFACVDTRWFCLTVSEREGGANCFACAKHGAELMSWSA